MRSSKNNDEENSNHLRVEISRPLLWSPEPPGLDPVTPVSRFDENVDEETSPDRIDTSYFAYLRGMQATPRNTNSSQTRTHQFFHKIHIPVLLGVLVFLWPWGFASYHKFQSLTDTTYSPVEGSLSQKAQWAFEHDYNNTAGASDWSNPLRPPIIVMLARKQKGDSLIEPSSMAFQEARNWTMSLNETLVQSNFSSWVQITSYYSLLDKHLRWLAKSLASEEGEISLIEIKYLGGFKDHKGKMDCLLDTLYDFVDDHPVKTFNVTFTGIPLFQRDLSASTRLDLKRMDTIVLPIALIVVGAVLRGNIWITWIIPLFTMITAVSMWSILMCFVARSWQISHFTPSIMMSLTLGMGIDYTLFLLSRYLEARSGHDAGKMLHEAGHVLVWSGTTLIVCFVGLLLLPLPMLQSVGIGAAVAVGCAMISNLILVPTLLCTPLGKWIIRRKSDPSVSELSPIPFTSPDVAQPSLTTSVWHRLSRHLLHPYRGFIILLICLQLIYPISQNVFSFKSSLGFNALIPWNSPALETYHVLEKHAGPGKLHPYRILFDGHGPNISLTSELGFNVMHLVIDELIGIDHDDIDSNGMTYIATPKADQSKLISLADNEMRHLDWFASQNSSCEELLQKAKPGVTTFTGIPVMHNARIPYPVYYASRFCDPLEGHCPLELLRVLHEIDKSVTSSDELATYLTATLQVDPFSDEGLRWLQEARNSIDRLEAAGVLFGIRIHIDGTAAVEVDTVHAVYASFPNMLVTTAVSISLLMGIFFRSIFQPLRSLFSICLTLCFSFGAAVFVFEKGYFNFEHSLDAPSSSNGDICWLVPLMAVSIIVGLALDYDVFLMSRILEYRQEGYEHKSSIAAGLDATGGIITAAGLIMAFAFGSLMFSSNPVLYQWSFLITTAVVLDTFVVRSLVVPVLTSLCGETLCWFPRTRYLPDVSRGYRELLSTSSSHHHRMRSSSGSLRDRGLSVGITMDDDGGESEYESIGRIR